MVTIEKILGLVLKIALLIAFLFAVAACVFPDMLMRIFTNDEVLIGYGVTYLRIVGISYLFMSVSQVFQAVMKAVFQV